MWVRLVPLGLRQGPLICPAWNRSSRWPQSVWLRLVPGSRLLLIVPMTPLGLAPLLTILALVETVPVQCLGLARPLMLQTRMAATLELEPIQLLKFTPPWVRLATSLPSQVSGILLASAILFWQARGMVWLLAVTWEQLGTTEEIPRLKVCRNGGRRHPLTELGAWQTCYRLTGIRGLKLPLEGVLLGKRPTARIMEFLPRLPLLLRQFPIRVLVTLSAILGCLLQALEAWG